MTKCHPQDKCSATLRTSVLWGRQTALSRQGGYQKGMRWHRAQVLHGSRHTVWHHGSSGKARRSFTYTYIQEGLGTEIGFHLLSESALPKLRLPQDTLLSKSLCNESVSSRPESSTPGPAHFNRSAPAHREVAAGNQLGQTQ